MLKHTIHTFMACWLCWGVMLLCQTFEYNHKFQSSASWSTASGRIIEEGNDPIFDKGYNRHRVDYVQLLFCRPYIHYSYVVNGKRYEGAEKLPVILNPIRFLNMAGRIDPKKVSAPGQGNNWNLAAGSSLKSKSTTTVTRSDGTKIQTIETSSRDGVVTEKRTISPNGATFVERKETRADGTVVNSHMSNAGNADLPDTGVEIPIKYRPSDPNQSFPGKDHLGGFQTLLQSALVSIFIPILVFAAMRFHANMVKPAGDDIYSQYDIPR